MLHNPQQMKESFSRAAPRYDRHALLQQRVQRECARMAAQFLAPGARVLDLGCGTGRLAECGHGWELTGIDLAPGMCREASARMTAVNGDAERLPFADDAFTGVVSSLALQWANDPALALAEASRVLQPGGACVIATFGADTLRELKAAFATLDDAPHVNEFLTESALKSLAEKAGFTVCTVTREIVVEHYPSTGTLLESLKAIGATSKLAQRKKGLSTPALFNALEAAYIQNYGDVRGVPATWEILFLRAQKP